MYNIAKIGLLLALLFFSDTGNAVRVLHLSLTEVRDQASSIIVALVVSQETRIGPHAKMMWTDYELEVEEDLLGVIQPGPRTLSFAGGVSGGIEVGIIGVPHLEVGGRYVLFLLPEGTPWATPTVGWGQGIVEIIPKRSSKEPEVLVSYDGELLEVTPTGLRRGDFVRRENDWIELPATQDPLRSSREAEPMVLDADGKEIEQLPQALKREIVPLDQRSHATLDQLHSFVLDEIQEDTGGRSN